MKQFINTVQVYALLVGFVVVVLLLLTYAPLVLLVISAIPLVGWFLMLIANTGQSNPELL